MLDADGLGFEAVLFGAKICPVSLRNKFGVCCFSLCLEPP